MDLFQVVVAIAFFTFTANDVSFLGAVFLFAFGNWLERQVLWLRINACLVGDGAATKWTFDTLGIILFQRLGATVRTSSVQTIQNPDDES